MFFIFRQTSSYVFRLINAINLEYDKVGKAFESISKSTKVYVEGFMILIVIIGLLS